MARFEKLCSFMKEECQLVVSILGHKWALSLVIVTKIIMCAKKQESMDMINGEYLGPIQPLDPFLKSCLLFVSLCINNALSH